MILRRSLFALTAAAAMAGAAHAQDQGGQPDRGPSPERRAAMQAAHQACASDLQTLCPGKERREAMMCLRENLDRASDGCKTAVANLPARRQPPAS